jgi:hypothetical protein
MTRAFVDALSLALAVFLIAAVVVSVRQDGTGWYLWIGAASAFVTLAGETILHFEGRRRIAASLLAIAFAGAVWPVFWCLVARERQAR